MQTWIFYNLFKKHGITIPQIRPAYAILSKVNSIFIASTQPMTWVSSFCMEHDVLIIPKSVQ